MIYRIQFQAPILMWFVIFLIMMPGAFGIGSIFASIVLWAKEAGAMVNIARGIIMIVCGITFPISVIPDWLQMISKIIPITHGIEAARLIMLNGYTLKEASSPIFKTIIIGIIYIIIGRLFFAFTEYKAKTTGSFDRY